MPTPPLIAVARARSNDDYLESVRKCGGEPLLVAADAAVVALLDTVAGVLLTGGPDVDPQLYGEPADPTYQPARARDGFELELVLRAMERDVPVFAICRGMQVLNVAAGGTLVQHIPRDVPQPLDHDIKNPPWAVAHAVVVSPGSRLASMLALPETGSPQAVDVNSRHHQAIKHVAPALVVTATARDGVIEAVERPDQRFCVAVQWHPENFWRTGEFDTLFTAFIRACRG